MKKKKAKKQNVLDVAIIGAGVSGVYSGLRLLTSERKRGSLAGKLAKSGLSIKVFEGSHRVGGRLLSVTPPGIPDTRVELGGMRFTKRHVWVQALVDYLKLKTKPFPVAEPQNISYLRGKHMRLQNVLNPEEIPYDLEPGEAVPALLNEGFTAVAAERMLRYMMKKDVDLKKVDWQEVVATFEFEGEKLYNLPLRYIMNRMISHEAFRYAMDSSGYDSILFTWNAADGFPWNLADFGLEVEYKSLVDGYETVPRKVGELFEKAGGAIEFGAWLRSFDQVTLDDGSSGFALKFATSNEETARTTETVYARSVVLAMPRRSIELLDQSGVLLAPQNEDVHTLIRSVTPIPLFKLAICYPYPWWETLPEVEVEIDGKKKMVKITQGESVTDLPIRQCYYWAVDKTSGRAVILIYDDGLDLDYWQGIRGKSGNVFETDTGVFDHGQRLEGWDDFKAPQRMVDEIHRQLKEIHGVTDRADIPEPYAASYIDWGDDPYGGGANFWHVGVESYKVSKAIVQPKPDLPVFICGESYSHEQGWVEGALATAEDMLQNHFGLKAPAWKK